MIKPEPWNHSLEEAVNNVRNPRSREYISDVVSSYQSGNYRAAVVGLWTVVVCDLLWKLEELRDHFQDTAASQIRT
jgi:hypothetical protein